MKYNRERGMRLPRLPTNIYSSAFYQPRDSLDLTYRILSQNYSGHSSLLHSTEKSLCQAKGTHIMLALLICTPRHVRVSIEKDFVQKWTVTRTSSTMFY